ADLGAEPEDELSVVEPVRMDPHITAAEALAVFRRKLPGAVAEAREVHHPFWWAALRVRTRRLLKRSSQRPGQSMNVLVNAVSGRAMIADFAPVGTAVTAQQWWRCWTSTVTGPGCPAGPRRIGRHAPW